MVLRSAARLEDRRRPARSPAPLIRSPAHPWHDEASRHAPFARAEEAPMAVAKVSEITSSSATSFEDAIQKGIARADKTLKNLRGAWIAEQKVKIDKGRISEYRVTMRVTFVLED
jgi:hypothetical protein